MWARVLFLLALVPACRSEDVVYYDPDGDNDNSDDSYNSYNDELKTPDVITAVVEELTRLRRWNMEDFRTLNQETVVDVRDNVLRGEELDPFRGPRYPPQHTDSYFYVDNKVHERAEDPSVKKRNFQQGLASFEVERSSGDKRDINTIEKTVTETVTEQHWSFEYQPETTTYGENDILAEVRHQKPIREEEVPTRTSIHQTNTEETEDTVDPNNYPQESTTYSSSDVQAAVRKLVQHWSPSDVDVNPEETTTLYPSEVQAEVRKLVQHWSPSSKEYYTYNSAIMEADVRKLVQHWSPNSTTSTSGQKLVTVVRHRSDNPKVEHWRPSIAKALILIDGSDVSSTVKKGIMRPTKKTPKTARTSTTPKTTRKTKKRTTTKRTTTTTTTPPINIDAIMAIISNLTYDYEWNLTEQFNKTLIKHGVPTCPWKGGKFGPGGKYGPGGSWTDTYTGSALPSDFENASVVSKCFVCGLKDLEIPRDAHCADAFAGDILPLMPIDARSRGKIAGFRKYCRYIDIQNYVENPSEPKAIYGRFTGGCAVRWTDVTGVYTQRTCRARYRPLLGKHFASKRMAKLELALVNVENGCIISPMATLLPVSRGISLYARFHACVCNSNWCNRATVIKFSTSIIMVITLAHWLIHNWPS